MRMVSIRRNNNGVGGHFSTSRVTLYAATVAVFILTAIYLFSNNNSSSSTTTHINSAEEVSPHKVMMNTVKNTKSTSTTNNAKDETLSNTENNFDRDEEGGNIMTITSGSVSYTVKPHLLNPENDTTQNNSN